MNYINYFKLLFIALTMTLSLVAFSNSLALEVSDEKFIEQWRLIRNSETNKYKLEKYDHLIDLASKRQLFAVGTDAVITAIELNNLRTAKSIIEKIISISKCFHDDPLYGSTMHQIYTLLGIINLRENNVIKASEYLLKSANVPPAKPLETFGPSMKLAHKLIQKGEIELVLNYLNKCKVFWKIGEDKIDFWIAIIDSGNIPDFKPNIAY